LIGGLRVSQRNRQDEHEEKTAKIPKPMRHIPACSYSTAE
jgi:hypothetical protein